MAGGFGPLPFWADKRACMKCLVTGATGFIGTGLRSQLEARGVSVTHTGREMPDGQQLADVHTVYHCAGIAHQSASPADYELVNHHNVLALAEAAAGAGVRKFIFLSSVKADPGAEAYGYWKWRAERELQQRFAGASLSVILVRPTLVYGTGVKANLRSLIRATRRGLPMPPAGAARSLIGLPDLCEALCLMADSDLGPEPYIVTDGQSYDLQRIYRAIRQALGKPAGEAWLPHWCWRLGCLGLDTLKGGDNYQKLFGGQEYSNQQLCRDLRWQPRYSLEDLLPAMLAEMD